MKKKTLIDALTLGEKEFDLAIRYMSAHHQEWVDLAYKDFYMIDNGDNHFYSDMMKDTFATRLEEDMGFNRDDAVQLVVHYFNNLVGRW